MTKIVGSFLKTCGVFVIILLVLAGIQSLSVFSPAAPYIVIVTLSVVFLFVMIMDGFYNDHFS